MEVRGASNDLSAACGTLNALINQINAQTEKKITAPDAAALIAIAERIKSASGC